MIQSLPGNSFSLSPIPKGVTIGKYTSIGEGVQFVTTSHPSVEDEQLVSNYNFREMFGLSDYPPCTEKAITIDSDVWIGSGAIILPEVRIGNGVIIGAGAVIGSNVPAYAVVIGNPWRSLRIRFTPEQITALEKIAWWEWDLETVTDRLEDMKRIDQFIEKYL